MNTTPRVMTRGLTTDIRTSCVVRGTSSPTTSSHSGAAPRARRAPLCTLVTGVSSTRIRGTGCRGLRRVAVPGRPVPQPDQQEHLDRRALALEHHGTE